MYDYKRLTCFLVAPYSKLIKTLLLLGYNLHCFNCFTSFILLIMFQLSLVATV